MPKGAKNCIKCGSSTGPNAHQCPSCKTPFVIKGKVARDTAPLSLPEIRAITETTCRAVGIPIVNLPIGPAVEVADFMGLPQITDPSAFPPADIKQIDLPKTEASYKIEKGNAIFDYANRGGESLAIVRTIFGEPLREFIESLVSGKASYVEARTVNGEKIILGIEPTR